MKNFRQEKFDATLGFYLEHDCLLQSSALVHLHIYRYSPGNLFWFGVAEIPYADHNALVQLNIKPHDLVVKIHSAGEEIYARIVRGSVKGEVTHNIATLSFVGVSPLPLYEKLADSFWEDFEDDE